MKKVKTSLDIPSNVLNDLLRFTKAKTKKDAIITAITEFNHRYRSQELVKYAGTLDKFITHSDLMRLRESK